MGKASSAKKVARAARAGGRVSSGQPRSLLFPGVVALVVVLGMALVVYARSDRLEDARGGPPQFSDHFHQAIGVNVCGEWLPDMPEFESTVGIHTHGDGVVHVHPQSQLGVGANATLDRLLRNARDADLEVELTDSKLVWLGETYEEGKTPCEGVDDPQLRMAYWSRVQGDPSDPVITTGDFGDLHLGENGAGFTIFYGDPDAEIPLPPTSDQLAELGALDGGEIPEGVETSTTTAPDSSTTTTAADATTTTAPGDTTTTSAP